MTNWNEYLRMIIKKIWLVLLIPILLTTITSYITLYKITPKYEANTKLFVLIYDNNQKIITYENLMAGQLLIKSYKEMVSSRIVTSTVINKMGLYGMTDDQLASDIDVSLVADSSLISISVMNPDPRLAVNIANEVSNVFIQKTSELLKMNNISLVDKAQVSPKPVYPKTIPIICLSFFGGIILSLGLILILVYLDDTVGDFDEVEQKTGLRLVGIIPDMKIR